MDPEGTLGVALGLVTAFLIGLFMAPRRHAKIDNLTFLLGMMAGAALGTFLYWTASGMPFQRTWPALFTLVPGLTWAAGTYAYAFGTQRVGLAKATGIKNTQVVVTTIAGFLLFKEGSATEPVSATIGAGLVVATAVFLSQIEHSEAAVPHASLKGYLVPVISSFLYGVNGIFMTWVTASDVPLPLANFGIGVGALLGGVILYAATGKRLGDLVNYRLADHALAVLGGLIWAAGLVTMLLSIKYAGLAVAWSLMNLSVVVSVLYGVVVFKEIDLRRRWGQVAVGLLLACLGVAALYLSKVLPAAGR